MSWSGIIIIIMCFRHRQYQTLSCKMVKELQELEAAHRVAIQIPRLGEWGATSRKSLSK